MVAGSFAHGPIQMRLQCWTRRSRPTPRLWPPEGDDLLVFCPRPHTPVPFPGWHLLALSASRQFLAVSHRCSREAAVCALTSGARGSATSGAMGAGEDPPSSSSLHRGLPPRGKCHRGKDSAWLRGALVLS